MPEPQEGASYSSAQQATANSQLVDSAVYHGLSLERVASGTKQKIAKLLGDAQQEITAKLEGGNLTDWQAKKAQDFLTWSNKTIANTYNQIDDTVQADLDGIKKAEIQKQINSVNEAVGMEISPAMSAHQITAIATADEQLVNGALMSDWWDKQAANLQHNVLTTVQGGMVQGKSTQEIAKALKDAMGEDSVTQAQANALVRTAVATVQSAAQQKYYAENDDIIKGIRWVSTLDDRTTPQCMALDGLSWKMNAKGDGMDPVGHEIEWPGYPPIHWNCRSTTVPVLKSWQELSKVQLPHLDDQTVHEAFDEALANQGFSDDEIANIQMNQQASMDGQVPDAMTYDEWLQSKDEATQKSILGPAKWQLWQDGKVSLMDMVKKDTLEPLTVDELTALAEQNKALPTPPPMLPGMHGLDLAERQILTAQMTSEATSGETWASWYNPENGVTIDQVLKNTINPQEDAQLKAQQKLVHLSNTADNGQLWNKNDAQLWAGQPGFSEAKLVTPSGRVITARLKDGKVWTAADAQKWSMKLQEAIDEGISDPFRQMTYAFKETGDKMVLSQTEPGAVKLDSSTMKKVYGPVHEEDKPLSYLEAHTNQLELQKQSESAAKLADVKEQLSKAEAASKVAAEESQLAREKQAALQTEIANQRAIAAKEAQDEATTALKAKQEKADEQKALAEREAALHATALKTQQEAADALAAAEKEKEEADALAAKIKKQKKSDAAKKGAETKAKKAALKKELAAAEAKAAEEAALLQKARSEAAIRAQQTAQDALFAAQQDKETADKIYAQQAADKAAKEAQEKAIKAAKKAAKAKKTAAAPVNTTGQMDLVLEPKAEIKANFPADPNALTVVNKLGGSTGAELVKDADGNLYVRKRDTNKGQVLDEFTADEVYRAAGAGVPEGKLYSTPQGPVKLTRYIDNGKVLSDYLGSASAAERDHVMAAIGRNFVTDAWLANWDVAGLTLDNVLVDANGNPYRIDNGGSLRYRGMGSLKSASQFGNEVNEIETLRNPSSAPQASKLFKGVSNQEIVDQVVKLYGQRDRLLAMFPTELRAKMAARLDWLDQYATDLVGQGKATMPPIGMPTLEPEPAPAVKVDKTVKGFPSDPMTLKPIAEYPVGNGKGEVVQDAAGNKYLRRTGGNADAMMDESRANDFMKKFGVLVPDHEMFTDAQGNPVMLQKFVEGKTIEQFAQTATAAERVAVRKQLENHFSIQALIGNTHVADGVRITIEKGKPIVHYVDNSGAFRYSVTGAIKAPGAWEQGHGVSELWTMRGRSAPHAEIGASAHTIAFMDNLSIVDVAKQLDAMAAGLPATGDVELDAVLQKRLTNAKQIATGALDSDHYKFNTEWLEGQTSQRGNFKQIGLTDRMAVVDLKSGGTSYDLVDQNGKPWDDLREYAATRAAPAVPGKLPEDIYYDTIVNAVKTVNHKVSAGGVPNAAKMDAAIAMKPKVANWLVNGNADQKALAAKYLPMITKLEEIKATGKVESLGDFQPYIKPGVKATVAVPTGSIPSQVRAEIQKQLNNPRAYDLIKTWAGSQSGSSQSEPALGMRGLWMGVRDVPAENRFFGRSDDAQSLKIKGSTYAGRFGLSVDEAQKVISIWNGFIQEMLGHMDMPNNDTANRVIRLVRKEPRETKALMPTGTTKLINAMGPQNDVMAIKGAYDSHSLTRWVAVHGQTYTATAMPHALVQAIYAVEIDVSGAVFFLADGENEIAADGAMVPIKILGSGGGDVSQALSGPNAKKWGLPLQHLREQPK
jgi:SPP1 gp7 family putative phage head morphogenesis protein